MTGLDGRRVYLDWNATAPLRPEARAAMLEAMDAVGNPSSVHAEGRAARAIVEKARAQVASLVGGSVDELVFTSSATEAAQTVLKQPFLFDTVKACVTEHDCVDTHIRRSISAEVGANGLPLDGYRSPPMSGFVQLGLLFAFAAANNETGVCNPVVEIAAAAKEQNALYLCDAVQAAGKVGVQQVVKVADFALFSGHKLGGPKGVGALRVRADIQLEGLLHGGGQEKGLRAGTENVVGIAGFGAAAEAAQRDLEDGVWERVAALRNILEARLEAVAPDLIFVGREAERLPNTTCIALPGWKGETQVMQLDLAGFAVSAGSACSSGKVKESRVLRAMGFDAVTASSAIRVSLGPTTTEAEITAFAEAWTTLYRKRTSRAA
ncbi:MAG: cysteine desulfurase family protein [Pseudomonadota bacterium]